jgi:hypothetical protein
LLKIVTVTLAAAILTGCNASDGTDGPFGTSSTEALVYTGVFTDSAVKGLTYKTATQSGVTDVSGKFKYQAGESIAFSIGNFRLGESATAAAVMTPQDLISGATLPTTSNELRSLLLPGRQTEADAVAFKKMVNILVLLQALDSDKDASNGISIADGMGAIIDDVTIDISTSTDKFYFTLKNVMNTGVTGNLISSGFISSPGQALHHFYREQQTTHSFKALDIQTVDINNDGAANSISTYTYDANGNQLTYTYDSNADGIVNSISTYTYVDSTIWSFFDRTDWSF